MKEKRENVVKPNKERSANLRLQDEIDHVTLGRNIQSVRKSKKYTQAQIAEILGLKPNYYGQYETGNRHINLTRLIQFICKMQCSADELLRGCHQDYPSTVPAQREYSETRKRVNSALDKCDDALLEDILVMIELMRKRQ